MHTDIENQIKHLEIKQLNVEQWVGQEENQGKIKRYLETNENEDTSYQNLWDAAKAVLKEKFIALHTFLRK